MDFSEVVKELARLDRAESLVKKSLTDLPFKEKLLAQIRRQREELSYSVAFDSGVPRVSVEGTDQAPGRAAPGVKK